MMHSHTLGGLKWASLQDDLQLRSLFLRTRMAKIESLLTLKD